MVIAPVVFVVGLLIGLTQSDASVVCDPARVRTKRANVVTKDGELTFAGFAQSRNLRDYQALKLVDPQPRTVPMQEKSPVLPKARVFLYESFHNRQKAYLSLTLSSVDATSTAHVFVEPDSKGRWRVAWRFARHFGEVDDLPLMYAAEWVAPAGADKPPESLRPQQKPDPALHKLQLRDECGSVVKTL